MPGQSTCMGMERKQIPCHVMGAIGAKRAREKDLGNAALSAGEISQ